MRSITIRRLMAVLLVLCAAVWSAPAMADTALYSGTPAKYVFFFIGDGMGIPQRTATEAFTGRKLTMDRFEAQGITTTYANDRFITGSAASATALATGIKTNINYIGVDPNFKPVKTLAEMARDKGMKVGIVSSVSIDHATPAAFYAHVKTRKMYHEIDHALAESGFDYFAGGGLKDPAGKKSKAPLGDALDQAKAKGYRVVTDKASFMKLAPGAGKVLAWNAWLQDDKAIPYVMDMTDKDITLPEFTAKGIELLDNPKGFFMMVEGGKIDWACHANDAAAALRNNLSFDQAVQVAVDFMAKHPAETLIVVTGDHECGGLTLGFAGTKYASHFDVLGAQNVSFQKFTDEILPAFKASGGKSFDAMKPLITKYFGLAFSGEGPMVLTQHEASLVRDAFYRSMAADEVDSKDQAMYLLYGGYDPLAVELTHVLNQKAGLGWTSYKHTGVPVSTSASGVGAAVFNGYYDNTDVALKIMSVMGVTPAPMFLAAN